MLTSKIATKIGSFLIEDCFKIVSLLIWPGKLGSYSNLSFWANEDIMRSYISDFEVGGVKCFCCHDDGINEIPEFWFIEEFLFDIAAIDDFITEKIGVVFVCDLSMIICTLATPPLPQN